MNFEDVLNGKGISIPGIVFPLFIENVPPHIIDEVNEILECKFN